MSTGEKPMFHSESEERKIMTGKNMNDSHVENLNVKPRANMSETPCLCIREKNRGEETCGEAEDGSFSTLPGLFTYLSENPGPTPGK